MVIFVYGTLKRGYGNYRRLLSDSTFLGEAVTESRFTMLHLGGFPGIVEQGETSIKGELFDIDEETLRDCDQLEGHPTFYRRTPIKVLPVDTMEWVDVETYVLPVVWADGRHKIVENGVWGNG